MARTKESDKVWRDVFLQKLHVLLGLGEEYVRVCVWASVLRGCVRVCASVGMHMSGHAKRFRNNRVTDLSLSHRNRLWWWRVAHSVGFGFALQNV